MKPGISRHLIALTEKHTLGLFQGGLRPGPGGAFCQSAPRILPPAQLDPPGDAAPRRLEAAEAACIVKAECCSPEESWPLLIPNLHAQENMVHFHVVY